MDVEQKKALVRSFFDRVWCRHEIDYIDEIYDPEFRLNALWQNTALGGAGQAGKDEAKAVIGRWVEGFPDIYATVEEQFAEGDFVICRHWSGGTHENEFMGIPPTGRTVKMSGVTITRVTGGKVAEAWTCWDVQSGLRQLGVMEPPPGGITLNEDAAEAGAAVAEADPEAAKRLVERYYKEVWDAGRLDAADGLLAPDFVGREPGNPTLRGPEGAKQIVRQLREGLPDLEMEIRAQHAEGGRVCTRYTAAGTHTGTLLGFPPSGKSVSVAAVVITRVSGDRIVSDWAEVDVPGLMAQLGG